MVLIQEIPFEQQQQHDFTSILIYDSLFSSIILGGCLTINLCLNFIGFKLTPLIGTKATLIEYFTIPADESGPV